MKPNIIYPIISLLLAACSADAPELPLGAQDNGQIKFVFQTAPVSRSDFYSRDIPGNEISVSSYFTDNFGDSQIYFSHLKATTPVGSGVYAINGWFWPLQGQMKFLGWWCQNTAATAEFAEKELVDGTKLPMLSVKARNLSGSQDFVYGVTAGISCPCSEPVTFTMLHGLSYIDIQLYAQVLGSDGVTLDNNKTTDLTNKIKVQRVYIEKCSTKGDAIIMPGSLVKWSIPNSSYLKDQVVIKNSSGQMIWSEADDVNTVNSSSLISITNWTDDAIHMRRLLVPEQKTAIIIDYQVTTTDYRTIPYSRRFDLSANGEWKPGGCYNYKIIFRNYSDTSADATMIESWTEMQYDPTNSSFVSNSFGKLEVNGTELDKGVVIDPVHDGGSAAGDDMDYKNGGTVF